MSVWMLAAERPGVGPGVTDRLLPFCDSPTRERLLALDGVEKEPLWKGKLCSSGSLAFQGLLQSNPSDWEEANCLGPPCLGGRGTEK